MATVVSYAAGVAVPAAAPAVEVRGVDFVCDVRDSGCIMAAASHFLSQSTSLSMGPAMASRPVMRPCGFDLTQVGCLPSLVRLQQLHLCRQSLTIERAPAPCVWRRKERKTRTSIGGMTSCARRIVHVTSGNSLV